jgi:hypothetical protein
MFNKKEYNRQFARKNPNYNRDYKRKYKLEHPEKIKEQDKRFREAHKNDKIGIKRKKQKSEWAKRNRKYVCEEQLKRYHNNTKNEFQKHKARSKAFRKIKMENQICEICKKFKAVERHHSDYSKPLEVIFLCKGCHELLHQEN